MRFPYQSIVAALPLALIPIAATGCRTEVEHLVNPKPSTEAETSLGHVPQFSDLPIPGGFQVEADRLQSNIHEAGHFRFGRQYFLGRARVMDVVRYFEERLPHHGWKLADQSVSVDAPSTMLWRKGDTATRIEIIPRSSDMIRLEIITGTSTDRNFIPK